MNNRVYQIRNKKEVNNTKNHLHIFILKFFIVVIVFGIVIEVRLMQSLKAPASIFVTVLGMVIF